MWHFRLQCRLLDIVLKETLYSIPTYIIIQILFNSMKTSIQQIFNDTSTIYTYDKRYLLIFRIAYIENT